MVNKTDMKYVFKLLIIKKTQLRSYTPILFIKLTNLIGLYIVK